MGIQSTMNIIISARNIKQNVSKLKKELADKLEDIERKYQTRLTKAEAVIEELPHHLFFVEVVAHGPQINIEAKAETSNIHESIFLASERLESQLHKLLDKKQSHR